jgi:hypothetical protein
MDRAEARKYNEEEGADFPWQCVEKIKSLQ